MNTDRWRRVKDIFMAAVQRTPDEREAFLEKACQEDPGLRKEVETLLSAHEDSNEFMELPTEVGLLSLAAHKKQSLDRIGQYLLQRVISSGGMGTVYEALQENPRRTVAVKVMKEGVASKSILRRFEYESQILASLRHPNIAQVIEAGTHLEEARDETDGMPYFVMEYIPDARHITDYAFEKKLSLADRLELFLPVCDAVHHGHQKGIIHRDLKPSNLLVDVSGKIKIIDFGVARALDSDLRLTTAHTDVGQLIGTVQYMSPEQCEADPHNLDIRSDVYALGMVLYELLCEELPYNVKRAAIFEATRVIREAPPKRPSTINRALKGDIETIVLKALEKDRKHRYQTVADLGEDVRRYLEGEVILAKPAGPATKVWKKVKRNPLLSGTALVALLAVITLPLYILLVSYPRIKHERDMVEAQKMKAEEEAENTKTINAFLEEMLSLADPIKEGRDINVIDMLDRAAKRIDREFPDRPEIEASLRGTLGITYRNNGLFDAAEEQFRKAVEIRRRSFGKEDSKTLNAMNNLAIVLMDQGKYPASEAMHKKVLEIRRRNLGEDHPDTLTSKHNLATVLTNLGRYSEAEALLREVMEKRSRSLGKEDPKTLQSMENLAMVLAEQGRRYEAETMHREVLDARARILGRDNHATLSSMSRLADLLLVQGKYSEAEATHQEILEIRVRTLGEEHPETLHSMTNLAIGIKKQGRYSEAEAILRDILAIQYRILGGEHPRTLHSKNTLANVLTEEGKYSEAESLHREVLDVRTRVLSEEHPNTLESMNNLANALKEMSKFSEAEALHRKVLEARTRVLGEEHLDTVASISNLGNVLGEQGRYAEAETMHQKATEIRSRILSEEHPDTLLSINNLANALKEQGKYSEAEAMHREGLKIRTNIWGKEHPDTLESMNNLANVLMHQGKYVEAEEIHRETLELTVRTQGREHPHTVRSMNNLAIALSEQQRYSEAEPILREALEIQRRILGDDNLETIATMNNLANALRNQNRDSEAEPLLEEGLDRAKRLFPKGHPLRSMLHVSYGVCLKRMNRFEEAEVHLQEGYTGYKAVLGETHKRTRYALEILIRLYEAWGKPEKAAEWRAILQ